MSAPEPVEVDRAVLDYFAQAPWALPLYLAAEAAVRQIAPEAAVRVGASEIAFRERYNFAFLSLPRRRVKGRPERYLVFTLGLARRLDSPRAVEAVEPYPGRWTNHLLLAAPEELDPELLGWLREARDFARSKGRGRKGGTA